MKKTFEGAIMIKQHASGKSQQVFRTIV